MRWSCEVGRTPYPKPLTVLQGHRTHLSAVCCLLLQHFPVPYFTSRCLAQVFPGTGLGVSMLGFGVSEVLVPSSQCEGVWFGSCVCYLVTGLWCSVPASGPGFLGADLSSHRSVCAVCLKCD